MRVPATEHARFGVRALPARGTQVTVDALIDVSIRMAPKWSCFGATHMPSLSIKNVPDYIVEKLRRRAESNHRSLQGELMALIQAATEGQPSVQAITRDDVHGRQTIEQIAQAHRQRRKTPVRKGPTATEVIRADRDAR
jgi:antitoxin FitA